MTKNAKCIPILPLFEDFIRCYPRYRANVRNRKPLSTSVVQGYKSAFLNVKAFQVNSGNVIYLPLMAGKSIREVKRVNRTWSLFYKSFTKFLLSKGLLDNYVGHQIKIIRTLCSWAVSERGYNLGNYSNYLHVVKDDTPIIALSMEHFEKLLNSGFHDTLPQHLQKTKDLLLFGCCVGLRYCDLVTLTDKNIEKRDGMYYLIQRSKKTYTSTRIKLPKFALSIVKRYHFVNPRLLPYPSKNQFNQNIKQLGEIAGWTDEVGKFRSRGGKRIELKKPGGKTYRFCDLLSSHVMRRTAITTLLINGMPEHLVRKISGHAANSMEFFRYVEYSQSFVDEQTDAVFERISTFRR